MELPSLPVQLVIETAGVLREVDVNIQVPDATVGDLIDALGYRAGDGAAGVVADGRSLQAYLALSEAGLHDGSLVRLGARHAEPVAGPVRGLVLSVVGGVDAGRRVGLRPGRTVIGREHTCEVTLSSSTVSSRHCVVELDHLGEVTVEDLGSKNGTWVGSDRVAAPCALSAGEILQVGAVQLMVSDAGRDDRPVLLRARGPVGTLLLTGRLGLCPLRTSQRSRFPNRWVTHRRSSRFRGFRCSRHSR